MSKKPTSVRERLAMKAAAKGYKSQTKEEPVTVKAAAKDLKQPKTKEMTTTREVLKGLIEKGTLYNDTCLKLMDAGDIMGAFKEGEKALQELQKANNLKKGTKNKDDLSNLLAGALFEVYYNLALIKQNWEPSEALEYWQKANELNPQDQGIIYKQWLCNLHTSSFSESIKAAEKLKADMKEVLIICSRLCSGEITPEMAKSQAEAFKNKAKNEQEEYWYLNVMLGIEYEAKDYTAAILLAQELQKFIAPNTPKETSDLAHSVYSIIYLYCKLDKYKEGLEYIEYIQDKYPKLASVSLPKIEYCKFLLYEHTGNKDKATDLLNKLSKNADSAPTSEKELIDEANQVRFFNELQAHNFEAAEACLEKTSLNKTFYLARITNLKQSVLSKSTELPEVSGKELPTDKELAIAIIEAEVASADVEGEEVRVVVEASSFAKEDGKPQEAAEPVVEVWQDPRAIHAYFQHKKALLIKNMPDPFGIKSKVVPNWELSDGQKISANQENVYKVANSENFYVYIKEGICAREQLEAFINAITIKGMVHRKEVHNGIKYCSGNGLAEVKINADARMWTDLTLCNEDGKYLLVIKHGGNHAAFAKAAQNGKMRVEKLGVCNDQYDTSFELKPVCKKQPGLECKAKDKDDDYSDSGGETDGDVRVVGDFGYLEDSEGLINI